MARSPRRSPLTREGIFAAALAIVDRDGLDAISMRRVGEELGVEAMSLYNHVPGKAAMLDGVFEAILAELAPPRRTASWEAMLRDRARAFREVLRAHPNAIPLFATRPAVTPASLDTVEGALEVLRSAGFGVERALASFQVLVAFVVGHTLATLGPRPDGSSPLAYDDLDAERFPRIREAAAVLESYDVEREFELGLEALVRGLRKP